MNHHNDILDLSKKAEKIINISKKIAIKNSKYEVGIDEVGKGEFFGLLIVNAIAWKREITEYMEDLELEDSKNLS